MSEQSNSIETKLGSIRNSGIECLSLISDFSRRIGMSLRMIVFGITFGSLVLSTNVVAQETKALTIPEGRMDSSTIFA